MGNRLSKIVTKTGDDGTTGISGNIRLPKDHARICAMGDVDELNATLGVCIAQLKQHIAAYEGDDDPRAGRLRQVSSQLEEIQHQLFNIGGMLSMPELQLLTDQKVRSLESWIEEVNSALPSLSEFILPGGNLGASLLFLAGSRARRTERSMVKLHRDEPLENIIIKYINRLSDYLFVVARYTNLGEGTEVLWGNPA